MSASSGLKIHCAIIWLRPAIPLLQAVAMAMVAKAGTLQVTQTLSGPELEKAPQARKKSMP